MLSVMTSADRVSDVSAETRRERFPAVSAETRRRRICRDGQHPMHASGVGGCGPEQCNKESPSATPAIPAGQAMTQIMIARLSQPSIAGLLPAPSQGNRVTTIAMGDRSVGRLV
jgi:hypothetical protein